MAEFLAIQEATERFGTPLYFYEEQVIRDRVRQLLDLGVDSLLILYALKANSNLTLLEIIRDEGGNRIGVDAVSPGEVSLALQKFPPERVVFTGNNIATEEALEAMRQAVILNVDSLSLLERIGPSISGKKIWIRVNPDVGAGHHEHCITGGPESKFGIWHELLPAAGAMAENHGFEIHGIHQHIGSGILDVRHFQKAMEAMEVLIGSLPNTLRYVDFGGGLGIPYHPGDNPLNLAIMENLLQGFAARHRNLIPVIEPGRFLVSEAGTLVARVTTLKSEPQSRRVFVGVDSGFNHLVRPMMYGSFHRIENVSNPGGKLEPVNVVGNLCESGDCFAKDYMLSEPREGDLLAIRDAGAYGYSMASHYNLRPKPPEVLFTCNGSLIRIRGREETCF